MEASHRIELANRRHDGIDVTLWWSPGENAVTVEVLQLAAGSAFELDVERERALEAFYHPFAHAAWRRPELLSLGSEPARS